MATSTTAPCLFPTVPCHRDARSQSSAATGAGDPEAGIARLAASSLLADAKRGAEYFLLPARSILKPL